MAFDFKAALKKKPVKMAVIAIVCVGGVWIVRSRLSSSSADSSTAATSSTGLDDAQAADMTSLQEQQNSIQAQSASNSLAASTSLSAQSENDTTQLALAGVQLQGLQAQLTAQTTQNSDTLNAQVALANVASGEATGLANITAGEQENIAGQESAVAIAQTNAALAAVNSNNNVAITNSNNQKDVAITQSNNSSGGCFITTAVCTYDGEADDCERLQKLRTFRDGYMLATPLRAALVELYYGVAPVIVEKLEAFPDAVRDEAYAALRGYIADAIEHIHNGQHDRAAHAYVEMIAYAAEVTK